MVAVSQNTEKPPGMTPGGFIFMTSLRCYAMVPSDIVCYTFAEGRYTFSVFQKGRTVCISTLLKQQQIKPLSLPRAKTPSFFIIVFPIFAVLIELLMVCFYPVQYRSAFIGKACVP